MSDKNIEDATDNLIDNDDLLSILGADCEQDAESALSEEDNKEADRKMQELKEIALQIENSNKIENPGSGDIDKDLLDWFNGTSKLPSDDLNYYVGNSVLKMDYGIARHTLSSFSKMGVLGKFLDSSFELLFSDSAVMGLNPEDLENRVRMAFTMYRELGQLNQRTLQGIKDYRMKSNSGDEEIEKMSILLSSIPSEKLKGLLAEINNNKLG